MSTVNHFQERRNYLGGGESEGTVLSGINGRRRGLGPVIRWVKHLEQGYTTLSQAPQKTDLSWSEGAGRDDNQEAKSTGRDRMGVGGKKENKEANHICPQVQWRTIGTNWKEGSSQVMSHKRENKCWREGTPTDTSMTGSGEKEDVPPRTKHEEGRQPY